MVIKNTKNSFVQINMCENLKNLLNKYTVNMAFKNCNIFGKFIKNNKSRIGKNKKQGVYKLNFGSCSKIYADKGRLEILIRST